MRKKILLKIIGAFVSLALAGCAHESTNVASPVTTASQYQTVAAADSVLCQRTLKIASYNLAFAKQQAKNAHIYTDWGLANKSLAAANVAYQEKDYDLCVIQAKAVDGYIERNQSYIKWRHSLNM